MNGLEGFEISYTFTANPIKDPMESFTVRIPEETNEVCLAIRNGSHTDIYPIPKKVLDFNGGLTLGVELLKRHFHNFLDGESVANLMILRANSWD